MKKILFLLILSLVLCSCGNREKKEPEPVEEPTDIIEPAESSYKDREDLQFDKLLDRKGAVTLYALQELNGKELSQLLQDNGYVWDEEGRYFIDDKGNKVLIFGPGMYQLPLTNEYDDLGFEDIDRGGNETCMYYLVEYADYHDENEVLDVQDPNLIVDVAALHYKADGTYKGLVAITRDSDGNDHLLYAYTNNEGKVWLHLTGMAAAETNKDNSYVAYMLEEPEVVGIGSLPEIWKNLTGKDY